MDGNKQVLILGMLVVNTFEWLESYNIKEVHKDQAYPCESQTKQ